ncbi:MAG: hypothetical protein ABIZ36_10710 [Gemmatimonadaceae bacterium]
MGIAFLLQQTGPAPGTELGDQIRQTIQTAQEAAADAKAAQAGQSPPHRITINQRGRPGTTIQYDTPQIPPQVEPISIAFFAMIAIIAVGRPLARAIARRIDRGVPAAPAISSAVAEQLQQISHSVDAIAIEVERISEGQRFTTKMLADRQSDVTMMSPRSAGGQ